MEQDQPIESFEVVDGIGSPYLLLFFCSGKWFGYPSIRIQMYTRGETGNDKEPERVEMSEFLRR